jgi:hypothetical protein
MERGQDDNLCASFLALCWWWFSLPGLTRPDAMFSVIGSCVKASIRHCNGDHPCNIRHQSIWPLANDLNGPERPLLEDR